MTYEAYTAGIERAELLGKVASVMSEKRFNHVLGVEKLPLNWQSVMVMIRKKLDWLD